MTYIEVLLSIQERKEKVLSQDIRSLITNQRRYIRGLDSPENAWYEDKEPGKPERRIGRGGEYWVWKRDESLPDPVAQFPEGT